MNRTFGDPTPIGALQQSARVVFYTNAMDLKWSHCSVSADYFSQFYAGVFAHDFSHAQVRDLTHSIAYLANELIENAVKFSTSGDITVETGIDAGSFVLRISNFITEETSERFRKLLAEISDGDPGDLLIERIETNAVSGASGSGLGILTLMSDYGVRLTWRFEPTEDDRIHLETIARLALPKIPKPSTAPPHHHGN